MITQKRLIEVLDYDPDTGIFTWKRHQHRHLKSLAGKVAGYLTKRGYIRIAIDRKKYLAHRLAWMYIHGAFPKNQTDHSNHNRSDNKIQNLSDVTQLENNKNQALRKNNKSGHPGVYRPKNGKGWRVRINNRNHKQVEGGSFTEYLDAVNRRKVLEKQYGYHINHGMDMSMPCP